MACILYKAMGARHCYSVGICKLHNHCIFDSKSKATATSSAEPSITGVRREAGGVVTSSEVLLLTTVAEGSHSCRARLNLYACCWLAPSNAAQNTGPLRPLYSPTFPREMVNSPGISEIPRASIWHLSCTSFSTTLRTAVNLVGTGQIIIKVDRFLRFGVPKNSALSNKHSSETRAQERNKRVSHTPATPRHPKRCFVFQKLVAKTNGGRIWDIGSCGRLATKDLKFQL